MATEPGGGLGLALSGGGFRATLYHLGVVRFLYDAGALTRVRRICSVSGGSILAAHLVLHWERYTGSPVDFDAAAQELLGLVGSDLRGRVVRRWLFGLVSFLRWLPGDGLTRTRLLEREYERLYGKKQLKDLRGGPGGAPAPRPELYLLTTSLTTGDLCCFTAEGLVIDHRDPEGHVKERTFAQPQLPLALAVAASSAFPPFFPPVAVTRALLHRSVDEFAHDHYLADGGIFDNLGVRKMQRLQEARPLPLGHVLVSDGQGPFDWALHSRYGFLPKRATRASDILMKRVSELEYDHVKRHAGADGCRYLHCCLRDEVPGDAMPPALQYDSRTVRTDLDPFSPVEIEVLVRRGYTTARQACQRPPELTTAGPPPTARAWAPAAPAAVAAAVDDGSADLGPSRKLRLRLWSPRDWASWASLLPVAVVAALALAPYLWQRHQLKRQEAQAAEALKKQQEKQDHEQGRRLRLVLAEWASAKVEKPARPGSLIDVRGDKCVICCVVLANRSKRCFLTTNTPFVNGASPIGERVRLGLEPWGVGQGAAVGVVETFNPVTFTEENTSGGALVLTSPTLVSAKMPPDLAIRGTAQPYDGQAVRVIIGTKALPGTVVGPAAVTPVGFPGKEAQFKGVIKIEPHNREDLKSMSETGGAPVIAEASHGLLGMTYSSDEKYAYVIPITALFQSLDVKELVTD